jgi:hypothetical protein
LPALSVTDVMDVVVSRQPTTTTFRSPAVCAPENGTTTVASDGTSVVNTELTELLWTYVGVADGATLKATIWMTQSSDPVSGVVAL